MTAKEFGSCIIYDISKTERVYLLKNVALDDRGYIKNVFQRNQC